MPHTTSQSQPRRKKGRIQPQKRVTITDKNGWSHVTTEGNLKRTVKKATETTVVKNGEEQQLKKPSLQSQTKLQLQLRPAEAPKGLNVDELRRQFQSYREKWEGSTASDALHGSLSRAAASMSPSSSIDQDVTINIICLGLGSPSGFLRDGWVDRRNVSMYQLSALTSIMDFYGSGSAEKQLNKNHRLTITLKVHAQDPVFNTLDKALLHTLGITVVEHPAAFDMAKSQDEHERIFLFCPGAERAHVEQLIELSSSSSPLPSPASSALAGPALLFGGPLEEHNDDSDVLKTFLDTRESFRLPIFESCEHAFWNMRLYWLKS